MSEKKTAFEVGDKAVYPAHGVGEVTAIESRNIGGEEQTFYILRILDNGMKIMVPTHNVHQVGMRNVIGKHKVDRVFDILRQKVSTVDTTTWNRRYRGYMEKIKTGDIFDVADVLRELYLLKRSKDLSFCELKLMDIARSLLCRELAAAKNCNPDDIKREFELIFGGSNHNTEPEPTEEKSVEEVTGGDLNDAEDCKVGDGI